MSLVGYDASSSEEEEEENLATTKVTSSTSGSRTNGANTSTLQSKLSSILPSPQNTTGKGGIQISAPAIPSVDSDSDEDENSALTARKSKQRDENKPRSGLFAKLPAPMSAAATGRQSNTHFMPYVFSKAKAKDPPKISSGSKKEKNDGDKSIDKPSPKTTSSTVPSIAEIRKRSAEAAAKLLSAKKSKVVIEDDDAEASDDEDTPGGFFSYVQKIPKDKIPDVDIESTSSFDTNLTPEVPYYTPPIAEEEQPVYFNNYNAAEMQTNIAESNFAPPDSTEMRRLQGKRNRNEVMNFIEIHQDDALEGSKEMLLKQISEEKNMERTSQKQVKVPGGIMKKKGQLTFLVQQAKARELELKNQWADNRMTKRQTQSKYGW